MHVCRYTSTLDDAHFLVRGYLQPRASPRAVSATSAQTNRQCSIRHTHRRMHPEPAPTCLFLFLPFHRSGRGCWGRHPRSRKACARLFAARLATAAAGEQEEPHRSLWRVSLLQRQVVCVRICPDARSIRPGCKLVAAAQKHVSVAAAPTPVFVCRLCVCAACPPQSLSEKMDSHTAQDFALDVLDVERSGRVSRCVLCVVVQVRQTTTQCVPSSCCAVMHMPCV